MVHSNTVGLGDRQGAGLAVVAVSATIIAARPGSREEDD